MEEDLNQENLFLGNSESNWYDELPDAIKESFDRGIKEADSNQGLNHNVVMASLRR